jgi:uncharacterized hydrophobic protein (TIGR00271 family)
MDKKIWSRYLRRVFFLRREESEAQTCAEVEENITFYGHNLWLLVFAIFIACVGLNYNSSAAVIGAMLISPLMGPVIGIGFGLVTHNFKMVGTALRHWLIAIVMSLLTSTIYFLITPVHDSTSQLYSFVRPTVFDALLAFFGGLAGFLGIARKDGSKILSGVAIATACIPPLCTAGYGIATLQWKYFFGGFYFYVINCLFIGVGTLLLARYMKFQQTAGTVSKPVQQRASWIATILSVLALIPCFFILQGMLKENRFYKKADAFVEERILTDGRYLVSKKVNYHTADSSIIEVTTGGVSLSSEALAQLKAQLATEMPGTRFTIHQSAATTNAPSLLEEIKQLRQQVNRQDSLIRTLIKQP